MAGHGQPAELRPALQDIVEQYNGRRGHFEDIPTTPHLRARLLDDPVLRASPSTATVYLRTPDAGHAPLVHVEDASHDASLLTFFAGESEVDKEPPRAPLLKDMDSFTEGSAVGSFNFSLDSDSLYDKPDEQVDGAVSSVAFSFDDPIQSIEIWRRDVIRRTTSSPKDELSQYGLMNAASSSPSRGSYPRKRRLSTDSFSEYRHMLTLDDTPLPHFHTASLFSVDCECAGSPPGSVDHTPREYSSHLSQGSRLTPCALPPL